MHQPDAPPASGPAHTGSFEHLLRPLPPSAESVSALQRAVGKLNDEVTMLVEDHRNALEELHVANMRLLEKIEELDHTSSDLRNLIESTEIATIFLDRNLNIRSFTQASAPLYNLVSVDQGRPLTDIVSRLNYYGLREDVAYVLATLEPLERRITRVDRSVHYIMRILPYREPDGAVTGVLITFVDITGIVQAQAALVEADVRKDVFLATLSHELRNPLAPIRTAAQLLRLPNLPAKDLMRAQAIITRQVAHISSLLEDLLDVSRITRGALLLKKEAVDVRSLMVEAVETVQTAIDAKGHTLRVGHPSPPISIEVDPLRLTQVLSNLLSNAAKYTPSGGEISLGCRLEANEFSLIVRDNGVGLAPEMITKIFTMFTQVETDLGHSEGGLGIGLALAKGLVELHGGIITAASEGLGQGSEFRIVLPNSLVVKRASDVSGAPTNAAEHASPRRILIVDDNRDGAETMGMLLEMSGHEIYIAHTGVDALKTLEAKRPHIGLLDIGLPDMSGYELAQRIRQERDGESMILIAVTGWGQTEDKRQAKAAGFDHHLTKPIDPAQLEPLFRAPSRR